MEEYSMTTKVIVMGTSLIAGYAIVSFLIERFRRRKAELDQLRASRDAATSAQTHHENSKSPHPGDRF